LFFEVGEEPPFPDIDYERGTPDSLLVVVAHEPSKGWQHSDGKVVYAEVAEILKGVGRG